MPVRFEVQGTVEPHFPGTQHPLLSESIQTVSNDSYTVDRIDLSVSIAEM